ncbi:MAG: HD domain-containing protein [Coprococcus sp.]
MSVNKDSKYHSLSKEVYEQILGDREHSKINPYACKNSDIIRRQPDHDVPHLWRPAFVMDVEKILHNNYYNRYSDKTQVISCYKNDDISRRALHVQLVSRIARTIGMTLGLNLDLIEAISLGHDIGHTPFGHAGERYLNEIYNEHTGRLFNHNIHSARVLDKLIFRNISLQCA